MILLTKVESASMKVRVKPSHPGHC